MKKDVKTYTYSINSIVDEIMKDADISISERFSPKTLIQLEIDNIVKFIKHRNKELRLKGQRMDIKEFVKEIYNKFQ